MGCNNAKLAALQELEQITIQIKKENIQLEKERDMLKSSHDDRPEEEKDSLQDLKVMHNDLEKEVKELKEIMLEFLPIPEAKDADFLMVKNLIENITNLQLEIEEKSDMLKEKTNKKKAFSSQQASIEKNIGQSEEQIMELETTIQKHEWSLKEQGFEETNKKEIERQRTLVEEIRNHHINFAEIKEVSKESQQSDDEESDSSSGSSEQKRTYENLLALSEMEINKELKEVQTELDVLVQEIHDLELPESEISHMNSYVFSLQEKLNFISKNSNFGEQISESQAKIEKLKKLKTKLKLELQSSKKKFEKDDNLYVKLQAIDNILQSKGKQKGFEFDFKTCEIVADVEDTLKKARQVSMELKKKYYYTQE
jgi:hypothetical protein